MILRRSAGLLGPNPAPFRLLRWHYRPLPSSPVLRYTSQHAPKQQEPTAEQEAAPAPSGDTGAKGARNSASSSPNAKRDPAAAAAHPLSAVPRAYGQRVEDFTPTMLSRPIGLGRPPQPGENTGRDSRTLRERKEDALDYTKHMARREHIKEQITRPYFREWTNLRFQRGKSFLAPPRPFRRDVSLYFPNVHGGTLAKPRRKNKAVDTTPLLRGKVSVVSVFSSAWGEGQALSFVGKEENPALHEALRQSGGRAQLVQVNIEQNVLRWWLIRLFMGSLRRKVGKENWEKYFIVRRGLTEETRESIGLMNSWVGYTYLLDGECRIRWAGSGASEESERQSLVASLKRLMSEADSPPTTSAVPRPEGREEGRKTASSAA